LCVIVVVVVVVVVVVGPEYDQSPLVPREGLQGLKKWLPKLSQGEAVGRSLQGMLVYCQSLVSCNANSYSEDLDVDGMIILELILER
jgi:hypothetical protein